MSPLVGVFLLLCIISSFLPRAAVADSNDGGGGGGLHRDINFASVRAGALILESSRGAKGYDNLLNDDKDKYGITPCSNKEKWVVIGLSEHVLIRSVVIVNYEKYSSLVKDFHVYSSVTHPVTEWHDSGTYRARAVLGEQVFNLTAPVWGRYLKFEFLSEWGDEHYCTLSQIKVHGSAAMETLQQDMEQNDLEVQEMMQSVINTEQQELAQQQQIETPPEPRIEETPESAGTEEQQPQEGADPSAAAPAPLTESVEASEGAQGDALLSQPAETDAGDVKTSQESQPSTTELVGEALGASETGSAEAHQDESGELIAGTPSVDSSIGPDGSAKTPETNTDSVPGHNTVVQSEVLTEAHISPEDVTSQGSQDHDAESSRSQEAEQRTDSSGTTEKNSAPASTTPPDLPSVDSPQSNAETTPESEHQDNVSSATKVDNNQSAELSDKSDSEANVSLPSAEANANNSAVEGSDGVADDPAEPAEIHTDEKIAAEDAPSSLSNIIISTILQSVGLKESDTPKAEAGPGAAVKTAASDVVSPPIESVDDDINNQSKDQSGSAEGVLGEVNKDDVADGSNRNDSAILSNDVLTENVSSTSVNVTVKPEGDADTKSSVERSGASDIATNATSDVSQVNETSVNGCADNQCNASVVDPIILAQNQQINFVPTVSSTASIVNITNSSTGSVPTHAPLAVTAATANGGLHTKIRPLNISCLEGLKYSEFQARMWAKLEASHANGTSSGAAGVVAGAGEGGGGASSAQDSVFKPLISKIKKLEMKSIINEMYTTQLGDCYRSVLSDLMASWGPNGTVSTASADAILSLEAAVASIARRSEEAMRILNESSHSISSQDEWIKSILVAAEVQRVHERKDIVEARDYQVFGGDGSASFAAAVRACETDGRGDACKLHLSAMMNLIAEKTAASQSPLGLLDGLAENWDARAMRRLVVAAAGLSLASLVVSVAVLLKLSK